MKVSEKIFNLFWKQKHCPWAASSVRSAFTGVSWGIWINVTSHVSLTWVTVLLNLVHFSPSSHAGTSQKTSAFFRYSGSRQGSKHVTLAVTGHTRFTFQHMSLACLVMEAQVMSPKWSSSRVPSAYSRGATHSIIIPDGTPPAHRIGAYIRIITYHLS